MDRDEYLRQQRLMSGYLGTTSSALDEALKATRPLVEQLGLRRGATLLDGASASTRTIADELALARKSMRGDLTRDILGLETRKGAIAKFLMGREAFSARPTESLFRADTTARAIANDRVQLGLAEDRFGDLLGSGAVARRNASTTTGSIAEAAARALAATRASLWATNLDAHASGAVAEALRASRGINAQLGRLSDAAAGIVRVGDLSARATMTTALAGLASTTALKMSIFGGSLDMFGPRAPAGEAAFEALFGTWRMRPDLPSSFFRDPATRARVYRDAELDEGLVDAASAEVVELLVESGAVAGTRVNGRTRAVIEIGSLRLTVTAGRARHDAFRVIDGFEVALRAFIGAKLAADCAAKGEDPEKWFMARVPGNIVGDAKRIRRDAYKAGEEKQPLINFTNLGELISVVTSARNWDSVFGSVFADREGFKVDLQRLTAHRRPAMHARPIDGPRLAEIVLVIRRLTALMEADGAWDAGWDDDT